MTELEDWLFGMAKDALGQGKPLVYARMREAAQEIGRLRAENEALKFRTLSLKAKE